LYVLGVRQYATCPPMTINPFAKYIATLHTTKGDLVIQLFPDKAPVAVNNFVFLARNGWFDGVIFHTVVPGLLAQTGDPSATGYGGPGYAFSNEVSDLKFDREGVVAMANSGLDSNGSQFFITYAPLPDMNGMYTIFGQLISGMDILKQFTPRDPTQGGPLSQGDAILSVEIQEK
jgi:cyclophilin family peptidyl-prolyl cis-trans isomerase